MSTLTSVEALEALYGAPNLASTAKVADRLTPPYRALIAASPFLVLATVGPEGVDCSPRGDQPGRLITVQDDQTLLLPDRRGNNRVDSLRNVVRDPRVGLLFLIPGSCTTLRLNGRGQVRVDDALLYRLAVDGHRPRSVLVVQIQEVFFQCARAVVRSELWNPDRFVDPNSLPTAGEILSSMSQGEAGGPAYDAEWPERAQRTLW